MRFVFDTYVVLLTLICFTLTPIIIRAQDQAAPRDNSLSILSFGITGALPVQAGFSNIHTVGGGGQLKLRIPISSEGKNQITTTFRGMSFFGKEHPSPEVHEKYKQRNEVQILAGYRYNFKPEADKSFYIEPQLGLSIIGIGSNNTVFKYETALGYYLNDRFDIGIWHQVGFKNARNTKIGAIGLMLNLSFNNLF